MTPAAPDNPHSTRPAFGDRVLRALGLGLLALWACGCAAAALAPLAVQGVGLVANMIGGSMTGASMAKHSQDKNPDEEEAEEDFEPDDFDNTGVGKPASMESRCNSLELITPSIIEFRADQTGDERWRQLALSGSADAPLWGVMPTEDAAANGWLPASNLGRMDFTPALPSFTKPGDGIYLAYAPAQAQTPLDRDQLASLVLDFGPVLGTFEYHGRAYNYSTLANLPCFPSPQ
jgi:hypothetical protein